MARCCERLSSEASSLSEGSVHPLAKGSSQLGLQTVYVPSWKVEESLEPLTRVPSFPLPPVVSNSALTACGLEKGLKYREEIRVGRAPSMQLGCIPIAAGHKGFLGVVCWEGGPRTSL